MTSFEEESEKARIMHDNYHCNVIVNKEKPYALFRASDVSNLLDMSNIRGIILYYDKNEKTSVKMKTRSGMQNVTFLTWEGLQKLILKSRKPLSIEFSKLLNIDKKTKFYSCIETDVLCCLQKAFSANIMIPQYKVGNYYIDLYFPEYLLAVECDEKHHDNEKQQQDDLTRSCFIAKELRCRFIRFKPFDENFDIFSLINDIYIHLSIFPRKDIEE